MPDLIYNVKFKIASKIDDLGGAGAAKSLTELNEAVDKTNRSTGKLGQEVKDLVAKNTEFIASNNKVKASIDNKRKATQNELRTIAKTNLDARTRIKQIREEKISLDKFIQSNKLNTAERTKLLGQSTRLERQEKELIGVLQRGRAALQGQEGVTENLTIATQRLAEQKRRLGKGVKSNNKAFSTANQTLFSLSDGLQDSAQFTQGFAQGMRAVGNNIGFTFELMGNLTTKTGGLKNAFKALGASLLGPGGFLIAINLLVTAATVLPQLLGKNKESAEDLEKALEGLNDDVRLTAELIAQTGAFDLGIEGLKSQKELVAELLQGKKEANNLDEKSLEAELEQAKIRARQLKESHQFRVFFEGEIASQEMVKQGKKDVLAIEQELERVKAENLKIDEDIERVGKEIIKNTEARRLAGLKLQEEGFVEAVKASLNVEPEITLLDGTEGLDALFQSFIDEELARKSVKIKEPIPLELEDGFELLPSKFQTPNMSTTVDGMVTGMIDEFRAIGDPFKEIDEIIGDSLELDLGPAAGTIAFAQEEIKKLTLKFNNTLESEEAATLANRINILKDFIAERQALLSDPPKDDFAENFKDSLDVARKFTKGITSLKKAELKAELKTAKARGASVKELESIRKKQFKTEKKSATAEAIINTASAIAEASPDPAKIAFAASLGAIQLATIRKAKFGGSGSISDISETPAKGFIERTGEESLAVSDSLSSFPQNNSSFLPKSSQSSQQIEVVVVNTFNEETVAAVARKGSNGIRTSQIGV